MLTETDRIIPGVYLACTHCKTGVIKGNPKTRNPESGIRNRNRKPESGTGNRNPICFLIIENK